MCSLTLNKMGYNLKVKRQMIKDQACDWCFIICELLKFFPGRWFSKVNSRLSRIQLSGSADCYCGA